MLGLQRGIGSDFSDFFADLICLVQRRRGGKRWRFRGRLWAKLSRGFRQLQLAGKSLVLDDHERVTLLQELHKPTETPHCLGRTDHLHAEVIPIAERVDGVEGGQHPQPATPSSVTCQDGFRRRN